MFTKWHAKERSAKSPTTENHLKGCGGLDLIEHISHHDHPEDQPLRPVRHGIDHNGRDPPRGNLSDMSQYKQAVR